MKDLRATRGAALLQRMIAEGEHVHQDFKYTISDARKIARSLSAFANHEGGRLLIGVKDNGTIAGVRNEEDIYVVEEAAEIYCVPPQQVGFRALKAQGGLEVIVATIEASECRPVRVREADGNKRAYFRVADENIAIHPLMYEAWEAEQQSPSVALTPLHNSILAAVERKPRALDLRELAIDIHASIQATHSAVVDLAASSLLTFVHTRGQFMLSLQM